MNIRGLMDSFDITPETATTLVCVLLAAVVLTRYTRIGGMFGFALNAIPLLAGAFGALHLTRGMDLHIGYFIERTLLVSFAGILITSVLVLLLFARPRRE